MRPKAFVATVLHVVESTQSIGRAPHSATTVSRKLPQQLGLQW